MNVLILTPDAVGSTLLQRVLTIYMQFHQFGQPVINLHELTNGLGKYYSSEFNNEIISRKGKWGYHQSLSEIIDILESVDHYKIARLAQYHIKQRGDELAEQLPFYRYLNDNFYIVECRRENLFEHAISHALNNVTKKLNVFTPGEKIDSFYRLYRSGLEIQPEQIYNALDRYRDYLSWTERHFSVGSYFSYETHVPNIEKYILGLPVFGEQKQLLSWKNIFDIEFDDWNRCHYYNSDIGALGLSNSDELLQLENNTGSNDAVSIVQNHLPVAHQDFLKKHNSKYHIVNKSIQDMQRLGIINTTVPIKKQTLVEKLHMIRNLDQCVEYFNHLTDINPGIASSTSVHELQTQSQLEYSQHWNPSQALDAGLSAQISN